MANETQTTTLVSAITAPENFDFRSVVTVLTARTETHLRREANRLRSEISDRKSDIEQAGKDLDEAIEAAAEKRFFGGHDTTIEDIETALSQFGSAPKVELKVGRNPEGWSVRLFIKTSDTFHGGSCATPNVDFKYGDFDEVQEAWELLSDLEEAQKEARNEAIEIRRRLADISSLERQVQAAFVERQLSESTEGAELLAQLDGVAETALHAWDPSLDIATLLPGSTSDS